MPSELPSLDRDALATVCGGIDSMALAFVMMAMFKKRRAGAPDVAQPAPAAEPVAAAASPVQLIVNGKQRELTTGKDGSLNYDDSAQASAAPATAA
jgi:hypothetical protein